MILTHWSSVVILLTAVLSLSAKAQGPAELYKDAVSAYEHGDIPTAIRLYRRLVELQPNSVQARTNLAVALVRVGRFGEAMLQYDEALKRDPRNQVVRMNRALALYKQAKYPDAVADLERLIQENPENKQSLYLLADCYLRLGRNKDVVQLLDPAFLSNPEDRTIDYLLGTALIRDGQMARGEKVIDRILKEGNTAEANILLGSVQLEAGDHKAAVITLRKAVELNPVLPAAWALYGRALLNDQDSQGAENALRRALKADADDFDANLYLGGLLRHAGRFGEAVPYLDRALKLRPDSVEARYQVGSLHAARGELDLALKELQQVARQSPDFQQVHVQLASVYQRLNRVEDSRREREIVLKLNAKERDKVAKPGP